LRSRSAGQAAWFIVAQAAMGRQRFGVTLRRPGLVPGREWGVRMSRPVLLAVDDDPMALAAVKRELTKRYGVDYRVICESGAEAGLRGLEQIQADGGQVALLLADQWMPAMTRGVVLDARPPPAPHRQAGPAGRLG